MSLGRGESALVYTTTELPGRVYAVPGADPTRSYELTPEFTAQGARVSWLGYSPNGKVAAHISETEQGRHDLYLRSQTGPLQKLSAHLLGVQEARFSPDSRWLAFSAVSRGQLRMHLADLSQTPVSHIELGTCQSGAPFWSANGSTLAFASSHDSLRVVRAARADKPADLTLGAPVDRRASLSPDGRWFVFAKQDGGLMVATEPGGVAREFACPVGSVAWFPLATAQAFLVECRGSQGSATAVCGWKSAACFSLGQRALGERCGAHQLLVDDEGIYSVSLNSARWRTPTPIEVGFPTRHMQRSFSRDCKSLMYTTSADQLVRVHLDARSQPQGRRSLRLPEPLARGHGWGTRLLWASPDGEAALVHLAGGLGLLRWAFEQTSLLEPALYPSGTAGWIDNTRAVSLGAVPGRLEHELLVEIALGPQDVKQRLLLQDDLAGGAASLFERFILAPSGESALVVAGSKPHRHAVFAQTGSADVPLRYDFLRDRPEALIANPTAPRGRLWDSAQLGPRALVFSAAVHSAGEVLSFVHHLRGSHRVPVEMDGVGLRPVVSADGSAAAFLDRGGITLMRLDVHGSAAPVTRAVLVGGGQRGVFSGDARWYVVGAPTAVLAIPVAEGEAVLLSESAQRVYQTAPVGSGVAYARTYGDGRRGLHYMDLATRKSVFIDLLPGGSEQVWFSDDGKQLAYTYGSSEDARFTLKMWRVGAPGAGLPQGEYAAGRHLHTDGGTSKVFASARALRGGHGLLLLSGTPYYLDPREIWVLPWLGSKTKPWRLPTDYGVISVQQAGEGDRLIAHEWSASVGQRLRSYRIGQAHEQATFAQIPGNIDGIHAVALAPRGAHLTYTTLSQSEHLCALLAADVRCRELVASGSARIFVESAFSSDGALLAIQSDDTLFVVDVDTLQRRQVSPPQHKVGRMFWLEAR